MTEILVLGAGYTGMTAALGLARRTRGREVRVTLVNPSERFTERLRLHQVAAGEALARLDIPAMLEGTGVRFVLGRAASIAADERRVVLEDGTGLAYDRLVYALGSVADTTNVPGAAEHAHILDGPRDAARFAAAAGGTVLVAGSGLTGVEAAAEIAERNAGVRVVLAGRDEPGAMMGDRARAHLRAALDRLGVTVRSGVTIEKVLPGAVELAGGELLSADAVLWTTGVRVAPLARDAGLTVDDRGRVVVDRYLRSVSHPEICAVGDAAAVTVEHGVLHGTCQSGIPTAAHAARAIAAELRGRTPRPFRFGYMHQPVSLGRRDAVIQFTRRDDTPGRFLLTGRSAVAYKEFVSSSPWKTYGMIKKSAGVVLWRH
ncbi:NAD(P)/FAD-dependent oxidoreductase [Actinocorallia longicatena]|uniref:FAD-dependent oxidoreductase n=1 Tax=Actinocorallia longicatena TaxID=111803 RepID=A0ABP6QEW5_9ACTN